MTEIAIIAWNVRAWDTIADALTADMHNVRIIPAGLTMSTPSPAPHRRSIDLAAWRPSLRAVWWVLLAFALGLGLFLLVWSADRGKPDFYRPGETPPTAAAPDYAPLPVPLPARGEDASAAPKPSQDDADDEDERPRLVETAPPPAPPAPAPAAAPPASTAAATRPQPIAGRTPAPRYPAAALRRGESGTVLVRAEIGPDGVPVSVSVADGSGSRLLDRAAVAAVERWRFRPAQLNGRPTVGTVMVPIVFRPD